MNNSKFTYIHTSIHVHTYLYSRTYILLYMYIHIYIHIHLRVESQKYFQTFDLPRVSITLQFICRLTQTHIHKAIDIFPWWRLAYLFSKACFK